MNNSGTKQQAQTVANALSGEKGFVTITYAITGDAIADLMAGLRKVSDSSGLNARQIQFVFECYARLYKDAADGHDRDRSDRERLQQMASPKTPWPGVHPLVSSPDPGSYTSGGTVGKSLNTQEIREGMLRGITNSHDGTDRSA